MEFPPDAKTNIDETISRVWSHFDTENDETKRIIDEWTEWRNIYGPQTNNATDYVKQLNQKGIAYHNPLKMILFDERKFLDPNNWVSSTLGNFNGFAISLFYLHYIYYGYFY